MSKFRHELKFILNKIDAELVKNIISCACLPDEHADEAGIYKIKSIYFDTLGDKCLYETLDGVNTRHKYRIRKYGNSDTIFKLEKKRSENGLKCKEVNTIDGKLLTDILEGDYINCSQSENKVLADFMTEHLYSVYRPVVVIGYTRAPYIYPIGNVRITFDSDIFVSEDINTFFEGENGLEKYVLRDEVILEVKYDEVLPQYIRSILNSSGILNQTSFSKYASGRLTLRGGDL